MNCRGAFYSYNEISRIFAEKYMAGRIMALDYGKKRTGIAVTDPLKIIASGLCTQPTPAVLDYLERYQREEPIEKIIIGQPRRMDHSFSQIEEEILEFIGKLKARFPGLAVERQDERFTSKMAVDAMVRGGMKKKKRRDKAQIDQMSATLILQSYLSRKIP